MRDMSATVLADDKNFLVPNATFFVELAIFLIVLGVIGTFVVPPIMKVLREREYMVAKTQADNKRSDEQFAAAQEDFENAMSEARLEASRARDGARAEGRKVLDDMRHDAEEEVDSNLQSAREKLKRQGDSVAEDLRSNLETISATLASRILGADVGASESKTSGR